MTSFVILLCISGFFWFQYFELKNGARSVGINPKGFFRKKLILAVVATTLTVVSGVYVYLGLGPYG